MQEILGGAGASKEALGVKLASADYHGAEMEVVRSGCPSRVGVKGVCIKETRGMFYIVTEKDVVKGIFFFLSDSGVWVGADDGCVSGRDPEGTYGV